MWGKGGWRGWGGREEGDGGMGWGEGDGGEGGDGGDGEGKGMGEDEEGWMGMGRARCVAGGGMGHKALRRRSTLHLRRCGSDRSSEGAVVGAGAAAV